MTTQRRRELPVWDGAAELPAVPRPDIAPEIGYGHQGPVVAPSPEAADRTGRYDGWPPVFQWEINPADPSLTSGEADVTLGDWEYALWWQRHPTGLLYASIQALAPDVAGGEARPHPLGRSVVVNLVYDEQRTAVVAIYGTARDFRPFVEAFRTALRLIPPHEEDAV